MMNRSVQLYAALLHLYPRRFRQAFGPAMLEMFEELAKDQFHRHGRSGLASTWLLVARELVPTLVREHSCELFDRYGTCGLLRPILACLVPALGYIALMLRLEHRDQALVIGFWLGCIAIGILLAHARGAGCTRNAVVGSSVGILLLFAIAPAPIGPGPFVIIPLMLAVGATIALALSTYVRLVIEGVNLGARHALAAS